MGVRIAYFICENSKNILDNFHTDFYVFRQLVLSNTAYYGDLIYDGEFPKHILDILNIEPVNTHDIFEDVLDDLIRLYIEIFGDSGFIRYRHTGSFINKWKYINSTTLVHQKCDVLTQKLWSYILEGRSVTNENEPSQAIMRDVLFGYWKPSELRPFLNALQETFGTKQELMDFYYNKDRIDKLFTYEIAGLECVYDILEEGIKENKEIIIHIEME